MNINERSIANYIMDTPYKYWHMAWLFITVLDDNINVCPDHGNENEMRIFISRDLDVNWGHSLRIIYPLSVIAYIHTFALTAWIMALYGCFYMTLSYFHVDTCTLIRTHTRKGTSNIIWNGAHMINENKMSFNRTVRAREQYQRKLSQAKRAL